jgi:hypothetical protein
MNSRSAGSFRCSAFPDRFQAAQEAIARSRYLDVVYNLLGDPRLGDIARDRLWEAIGGASWTMGDWILQVVTELPHSGQRNAIALFERWLTAWGSKLQKLSESFGPVGDWAKDQLQKAARAHTQFNRRTPGVGKTVGAAAAHALNKLHPTWTCWNKPSQKSFRRRQDGNRSEWCAPTS